MTSRLRRALAVPALLGATLLGAPARPAGGQPAPAQPPGATRVNFVDARLADVIRSLATTLGLNVVLSDVPDRRVTFQTAAPVPREALGEVLESILEQHGLVLLRQGVV